MSRSVSLHASRPVPRDAGVGRGWWSLGSPARALPAVRVPVPSVQAGLTAWMRSMVPALSRSVSSTWKPAAVTRGSWRRVKCSPAARIERRSSEPLNGVDRRPRAADVVQEQQAPAGGEDSPHLAERCGGAGDGAQGQRTDDGVERGVVEWQVLGVCLAQGHVTAEVRGALPGDGQHGGAELDAGDTDIGRVVGQAAAGADGDFEDPAAGARAEPFPPAGEPDLLEEADLPVVAGRGLVPDPLLPRRRRLASSWPWRCLS